MQPFDYMIPHDYAEASALLAAGNGSVRPLLGGTDLLIRLRGGFIHPDFVVDLKQLPGMREIRTTEDGWLVIGAACTMNQVAAHPLVRAHYGLLAMGCESVASYQLRNRATLGGNCCNASPAADSAPALYCFEAIMETYGPEGKRRLPVSQFFAGPRRNALLPGEFLTSIHLPPAPPHSAGAFHKLGRTQVGDISIVSVAVWATDGEAGEGRRTKDEGETKDSRGYLRSPSLRSPDASPHPPERVDNTTWTTASHPSKDAARPLTWRIAIGAAGPTPLRAPEAEAALAADASPEGIARAAELAAEAARPIDDIRAGAAYRRAMVAVLARRGVQTVLAALEGQPEMVVSDEAGGRPQVAPTGNHSSSVVRRSSGGGA